VNKGGVFFLICLLEIFAIPACGGVQDHLKKAEGKSAVSKIRNIDFIYMINLDQRPEKFSKASLCLSQYGIYPYRFSAVNGWELSLESIDNIGLKYESWMTDVMSTWYPLNGDGEAVYGYASTAPCGSFGHFMSKGAIGICLSHISILQDAWDSGYETVWVMEDDVVCEKDPRILSSLIDRLDNLVGVNNWDVLFTDRNSRDRTGKAIPAHGSAARPDMDCTFEGRYRKEFTQSMDISPDFTRISARFGAYSMIIRRSGIKKLLDFAKKHHIYLPYDMDNYLDLSLKRYSLRYDVVSNDLKALTDNAKPYYLMNGDL
jgi:GR25 family glycosyltransferase involved in LPS biosynthesis